MTAPDGAVRRFSISDRAEHWVQMIAFVVLAATGLCQRYDGVWVSERLIDSLGGIESVRDIHRWFATLLMVAVVYHYGAAFYRRYVLGRPRSMVPGADDARALWASIRYAFGRSAEPPPQGRFTWEEKVEYWSFVWGTVIMVITGFLLWNPIATTHVLPGQLVPAAKAAHGAEATLAVLAIVVWHVYHVHVRHFNKSMFTGDLSRHEMEAYHPLELASIEAGENPLPGADVRRVRLRRYLPICGVISVGLLVGVYLFVTFEKTAIDTVEPPEQVQVFAPVETLPPGSVTTVPPTTTTSLSQTTTTQGAVSTTVVGAADTWDSVASLFDPACTSCHGPSVQTGGLDLSSYATAVTGGNRGAGIVPGDPAASVIVQIMEAGGHPGQLTAGDVALLTAWIEAGAPEE